MTLVLVKSQMEGDGKTILLMRPKVSPRSNPRKAQEWQNPLTAALRCLSRASLCLISANTDAWLWTEGNHSPAKVNETLAVPSRVYGIWLSIQPTSTHFEFSILSFPIKGDVHLLLFVSWSVTARDVQGPQHGQVSWELDFRISWFFLLFILWSLQASSESKPYVIPQTEL